MFGQLLIRECRQTAKSLVYWVVLLVLLFFYNSQLGGTAIAREPQKGQGEYGYHTSMDEQVVMESTLGALLEEYSRGNYRTYPIGFIKHVTLNEKEEAQIGEIIRETTGYSTIEEIEHVIQDWYETQEKEAGTTMVMKKNLSVKPVDGLSYSRFTELMEKVDDILGGGSKYGEAYRGQNAQVPMTYEEAMAEYQELIEKDRLTGGYARLFSDYMVIFLGILPVFLAVTRGLRDRRCGMQDLIYTRKSSSAGIVVSRYLAMLIMLVIPLLLLSMIPLSHCLKYASTAGISADPFAYVKYTFGWLLPTVMAVTAVGTFLTELTDTALAILVQGAWWFIAVFSSTGSLHGGAYGWTLVPRHNTEMNWAGYHNGFAQLAANRILYASFAVLLVLLTVFVYSQKRKGRYRLSWKNIGRLKK